VFEKMVLKRVLDAVGRLENAIKTQTKSWYCEIRVMVLI